MRAGPISENATLPAVPIGLPRRGRRMWLYVILGLVGVIALLVGVKLTQFSAMMRAGKSFVPPPESVTTAKVDAGEWQGVRQAVGTLVAVHGVTVGAELP